MRVVRIALVIRGNMPRRGDTLAYDIEENPSKPGEYKAVNITGGTDMMGNGKLAISKGMIGI